MPPTTVSTAIVTYGLAVTALVMFGAKLGQRIGWLLIFRIVVALFAVAELIMMFGPTVQWIIGVQALAGASAGAPFDILGLSPAVLLIIVGVLLGQAFFAWTRQRTNAGKCRW